MDMKTSPANAWDVHEQDFPRDAPLAAKAWFALRYALLAPSSHNSQPWRFLVNGDIIELLADRTRSLPVSDPYDRELIISCGAALFNLRSALAHFGVWFNISLFPSEAEPDLIARVRLAEGGKAGGTADRTENPAANPIAKNGLAHLFPAITRRATNRTPFSPIPVPERVVEGLCAEGASEGVAVKAVTDGKERGHVAGLIAEADHIQFADARFRRELAAWIHPQRQRARDGMPAYALGVPRLMDFETPITAMVIRTFDVGDGKAAHDAALAAGSPLLLCFSTTQDNAPAWLFAGQSLQRVLLQAKLEGYDASYLNQPIEVPALRTQLRDMLQTGPYPQLLIRVGRGNPVAHTPRRAVEELIH